MVGRVHLSGNLVIALSTTPILVTDGTEEHSLRFQPIPT